MNDPSHSTSSRREKPYVVFELKYATENDLLFRGILFGGEALFPNADIKNRKRL